MRHTNTNLVQGLFTEAQKALRLKFRGWEGDLPHQGEKGGIRERRVRDFLATFLPKKYGIGTGHVIDSQGNISSQTDIVVYDAQEGFALPVDPYYSLFPCECVYLVLEVKSELNASDGENGPSGSVTECLKANTQLKSLDRKRSNLPPIHYVVFVYTSVWINTPADNIKNWFESLGQKYALNVPEVVFILEPCFVLGTSGPTGYNDSGRLTNIYDHDPLLYFISDLIHCLSRTDTATPNLWYEYNRWLPGDVITRNYQI